MSLLEERLRMMAEMIAQITPGRRYEPLEAFVLKHANVRGRIGATLTMVGRGTPKECFRNAYNLATRVRGLSYCEGYVMRDHLPIPILHAWVVDKDGDIIDNTLERPEECEYIGIKFDQRTLLRETNRLGYYGLLDTGCGFNTVLMDRMNKKVSGSVISTKEKGHG